MSAICMCKDLAKTACVDKPDSNRVQRTDILFQDIILYRKFKVYIFRMSISQPK